MSAATRSPAADGPLSQEHYRQLTLANERAKKVRKAANVAGFNGWVTAIFAVLSAPFALFSIVGFLVTVALSVVAYNEFRGRKRLLQFDSTSTTLLGWNQVGFLAMIILYSVWMLFVGLTSEGPFAAEMAAKPELAAALGDLGEFDYIYRILVVAVYGTVILLSVVFQGVNAMYYFTRRKHLEQYMRETATWILDLQRATVRA